MKKKPIPRHDAHLDALLRIEGQVRGITGMVREGRYCIDILTQTRAIHAALRRIETDVFQTYLETCARQAFAEGDDDERREMVGEIVALFDWQGEKGGGVR